MRRARRRTSRSHARVGPRRPGAGDAEPGRGNHPQGALAAQEHLGEAGAGRRAGAAPSVVTTVPSASTTSSPTTRSSILPYRVEYWPAPRHATHPPTVEMSIDWGQWPNVYPVPVAERAASSSGPNVPAPTSASSEGSSRS